MLRTDAHPNRAGMGHHGHAQVHHRTLKTVVASLAGTACEQTGAMAFHHRATRAAGTGQVDLVRGALAVQARLREEVVDFLRTGMGLDGLDGLGEANCQYPARRECPTPHRILDAEITRHRVDPEPRGCLDTRDGSLPLVASGQHLPGIARMALGDAVRNDTPGGGVRHDAGCAATLGRAMPLACDERSAGRSVGMDDCTVRERCALGEPLGWLVDRLMGAHHQGPLPGQTLALGRRQVVRLGEEPPCLRRTPLDGLAERTEWPCGVADHLHEDVALPPAWAAKTTHDLCQLWLEAGGSARERGGLAAAPCNEALEALEGFFCAL